FRRQVIAIDAAAPTGQVPGVAVLGGGGTGPSDREVAQVVAALRRLSVDNGVTYWGPGLERVFETFVRAAQEEGGGLLDVHALLTDARRREACRLTTRSDEIARFLDELPAVLRRNPEFLWTAASRTAKLALDPRLASLVAPSGPGLDVSALLDEGRSVLWRLPLGELGPEGAQVAANLLLSHVYLGRTAISERPSTRRPLLLVLDEAHAFSAPLLVEILAEGRKFGVRAILASQYPDRLSAAATAGSWTGLNPHEAQRILPVLPPGVALMASYGPRAGRRILRVRPPGFADPRHWADRVAECSKVYAGPAPESSSHLADIEEALLLALLSAEVRGKRLGLPELVVETGRSPNLEIDPTDVLGRVPTLLRRGWISDDDGSYALTGAGHQRLGWTTATGATRESAEHRALLLLAYRIFARHAVRLEIVRQGRFDTRLPDARVTLLSARDGHRAPAEIAARIDRLRTAWVWKAFGGRDVYVEAEVSGADRPERLRRGVLKARHAGAFLLFLVCDGRRAAKVRSFLRSRDVERHLAQVWTLSSARLVRAPGATEGE
ncbi:MAG: hypothetical protein L3J96_01545, partial [Thermoplasmata archaeon]|nr:hypothetical protein [Thermoplasmata archaeon]